METEKASHATEESLSRAPFGVTHPQTEKLISQLQNGSPSPEAGSPHQLNGDAWGHFKPSNGSSLGANPMKRHRENCSSPASMQGLFDQAGVYGVNGEMKHSLSEQAQLGPQQPKRPRVNGNKELTAWERTESGGAEDRLDGFPELTKLPPPQSGDYECDNAVQDGKLDSKRNFNLTNGDIFSLSRSKSVSISNGATETQPSMVGSPGDLLEKTLSQYYPQQVSIAPQTGQSQADREVCSAVISERPEQNTQAPSLTSGYPISSQMPASEQQARISPELGNGGFNTQFMNGFSSNFRGEHQQHPQKQQQQQQQHPLPEIPDLEQPHSLDQAPGMVPPQRVSPGSQAQNGSECFHSNPEGPSIFSKPNAEFNQGPYLPSLDSSTPLHTNKGSGFGPFSSSARPPSTPEGQLHMQYGAQQQQKQQQQPGLPGLAEHSTLQGAPGQSHPTIPSLRTSADREPESQAGSTPMQGQCGTLESELSLTHTQEMSQRAEACSQMGWIDLNSQATTQSPSMPSMWGGFPPQSPVDQQPPPAQQTQGQSHDPSSTQSFLPQGFNQPGYQKQQQDCQTHDWQQRGSKPSPTGPLPGPPKLQHMPQQCSVPPQQADNQFCAQQEHLCKDQDLEQILSPNFIPSHQQPLLPPHSQHEGHQVTNALQRQCSQDSTSNITSQPSDPSQGPMDPELLNRLKMESYMRSEKQQQQLKSPTYRAQPGPSPQPMSSPSHRPKSQPSQNDQAMFGFGSAEGPGMKDNFKFNKAMEMQKQQQLQLQQQYSPGPSAQKQYPQQQTHSHNRMPNHMDFPSTRMPPPSPQQAPGQMYPKLEHPEACAQYQRDALPSPGPQGDFQRHAALRMHLLQKQERHAVPQCPNDLRHALPAIKQENGLRFEAPHMPPQQQGRELLPNGGGPVMVKQERPSSTCEQSQQQRSILATMEQQLRQYQLSPVFEKKSLVVKSPNKVKVEMSGGVTVLSTNVGTCGGEDRKPPEVKREPGLQSFLESPMKLLDTPIKNLLDTPVKTQYEIPPCHCLEQISEKDEGPYYTHLGAAPNIAGIREMMEKRSGFTGSAIRIEKVVYTGKEGKSTQGCPIAKWVIRRASVDEKLLVLVRERPSHKCETSCLVIVILIWEGISISLADRLYSELSSTLTKHGALTNRRCALNEERTCACQGLDPDACGASFSFGCSWSMYYNGCKFARSKIPRKFKLLGDDPKEEERLEYNLQNLATIMAPMYKKMAPDAYGNQVEHEHRAPDCRLGVKEGRPFSGVTACLDFCAHAHRDLHNMQGGSTVVCTLTREDNREISKIPEDEQLHVLPLYKASNTDEFGSEEAQREKTRTGAIQVLSNFRRQVRMLAEPAKSCRQKKLDAKRASANKLAGLPDTPNSKGDKTAQAKKQSTYENPAGQNTLISGVLGASLQHGQQPHPLQHQQAASHPFAPAPGSPHPAGYPRFPSSPSPFPSTPKPGSLYPQSPISASPYPSPLHVPNSYMNGGNPASPYPNALTPNNLYPGYQCNGGMAMENYHPYYPGSPKHLEMYRQQRPPMYPEQQYGGHQRYGVNYPPRYSEPGLQVNGFGNCAVRPGVHPVGPYPPYPPSGGPEAQYLEAISRPPSSHPSLDYASVSKGNQFSRYPNTYLSQNPQMFAPGLDPLRMQAKPDMSLHGANGMPQGLPPLGSECLTPGAQPPFGLPNGSMHSVMVKQEPGAPIPTTPKGKEDVWSDNEHNFLDPDIGGVAVAPSHGSILIECAKRELHATTPLKQPNRTHPTRISLVFYQHKNMNEAKHGLALWEAKLAEKAREKEEDAERGIESTPSKSNKKVKREPPEYSELVEPPYKRFIQTLTERSMSSTTNTYVGTAPYAFTKVTGPYNCFM
ncbi:methylcytosine dioxygenase TET2 [Alosa sapidissima]|uniref:methylcytosine dioxygenase TET2 n=1 Tax=Alosa sapidissima TaxID=34773 RepID=UPI001C099E47|nr:methylcytosine dioxygenase TET2 [Alosa sapidissima]XP_041944751.1 methylcytosine dioxygenase TET2 [Alosa sapidissima]